VPRKIIPLPPFEPYGFLRTLSSIQIFKLSFSFSNQVLRVLKKRTQKGKRKKTEKRELMLLKFYDRDPNKTNPANQNATLPAVNLSADLFTEEGRYKASLGTLIRFEADSFFIDSYELVIQTGEGEGREEVLLSENVDFFLGEEDVELGSPFRTALGVRLQDTGTVRLAREGQLILRAWVGRQNLKARDLNALLALAKTLIQ
jgi:hypothetical protein